MKIYKKMEYLHVKEIMNELRVSRDVVYHWIRSGQLPALKIGRKFLISLSDYKIFIKEHEHQPSKRPKKR